MALFCCGSDSCLNIAPMIFSFVSFTYSFSGTFNMNSSDIHLLDEFSWSKMLECLLDGDVRRD